MIDNFINQLNLLDLGMVLATMCAGIMTAVIGIGGAIVVGIFLSIYQFDDFSRVIYQTIVIASNCFMSVAFYYFRTEKKVDFKLVVSILPGAVFGVLLGFFILYQFHQITDYSRIMYVFILSILGIHGLYVYFTRQTKQLQRGLKTINKVLPLKIEMEALSFPLSYVLMFVICFAIYTVSTVAGIGGNIMLLTLMIYFLGVKESFLLPSLLAVAFIATTIAVLLDLTLLSSEVDPSIISPLLIGSFLGTFIGVQISKYITLRRIKIAIPITMILLALVNLILDVTLKL